MKLGAKLLTVALAIVLPAIAGLTPVWAASYTYNATSDFTDINAGAVPYYRHGAVQALAINAAIESYRGEFARATLVFEETAGTYDVTITALGETDGDGEFRFLVDGVVVGNAINEPATEDYGEQQHTFENISIPSGALIGVESVAVSNGLIPEGDGYAYARGRWTTLTIKEVETDTATPDPVEVVDLSVTINTASATVLTDEEVTYTVAIENSSSTVATNPVATISLPAGITYSTSDECIESDPGMLSCELSEITPNDTYSFTFTTIATTIGAKEVSVEVSSDQDDDIISNNSSSVTTSVENKEQPVNPVIVDNSVDLQLTITADKEQLEVEEALTYTLDVSNLHDSNVATSPLINIALPDSLQFEASDICTADAGTVHCRLEELPPADSTTVQFTATAVAVNSYVQIIASLSSTQSDNLPSNNDAVTVTKISAKPLENIVPVTDQPTNNPTDQNSTTEVKSTTSGGGALNGTALALILLPLLSKTRRTRQCTSISQVE